MFGTWLNLWAKAVIFWEFFFRVFCLAMCVMSCSRFYFQKELLNKRVFDNFLWEWLRTSLNLVLPKV
ncbi:unnamed protein product [Meloidogyne enterolobii]|uniref:Uncharacterized protein n=1 Tax=Meloidogyne enterolobii TaxID=390850 RepID=A0ACB1AR74_MELEN